MNCPKCGNEMEEGYLSIPLHLNSYSIKWNEMPDEHHIIGGEILYNPKTDGSWIRSMGSVFLAYRCRDCMYVTFHYKSSLFSKERFRKKRFLNSIPAD